MTVKAPKILDNKFNFVYQEFRDNIKKESKLSVVSALFSMYAYDKLKKHLNKIDSMRFIYTKPSFLKDNQKESRNIILIIIVFLVMITRLNLKMN